MSNWLQKFFLSRRKASPLPTAIDWRQEVQQEHLTREQFCNLCVIAIRQMYPDATIEPVELPDQFTIMRKGAEPTAISFENIWRQCKLDPESRVDAIERFARVLAAAGDHSEAPPDKKSIVPIIRDEGYLNVLRNKQTGDLPFANEHFAGDLWIIYAIDTPDAMKTLHNAELEKMDLKQPVLKKLAIENLRRILPPVERHGDGPVYMLTAGADYVASLILLGDLWGELKGLVMETSLRRSRAEMFFFLPAAARKRVLSK